MKAIELTQGQKDKLIEMAVYFYPEYSIGFTFNSDEYFSDRWSDSPYFGDIISFTGGEIPTRGRELTTSIHWFEFCIKYLILKLSNSIQSTIDLRMLFCEFPNPIDYLYSHFEKLNK